MSVEEARAAVLAAADDLAAVAREVKPMTSSLIDTAIDRLILEVQAEMPCYLKAAVPLAPENERCGYRAMSETDCPSCTACMQLKEVADAR